MASLKLFPNGENERLLDLVDDKISLGRVVDNHIPLEDPSISSHHAEFILQGETYLLRDLGSTNGTFVNGQPITEALLAPGDEVRFGSVEALYNPTENSGNLPLPEPSSSPAESTGTSSRPPDFTNSSPFPKTSGEKDGILQIAYGIAALASLAFLVALYAIFKILQTPTFPGG